MTRDEFFELDAAAAAAELNAGLEAGKSKDEVLAEHGIAQAEGSDLLREGQVHCSRLGWIHLYEAYRQ